MRTFQTWLWAGVVLLGVAWAWSVGRDALSARTQEWRAREAALVHQAQRESEQELEATSLADQGEIGALESRHAEELRRVTGGSIASVLRDPNLSIEGMLREVGLLVLPRATSVVCKVDRFVEYSLVAELSVPATPEEMAGWSREILTPGARYLYLLRFVRNGEVLASLDRRDIEAFADWSKVGTSDILTRFSDQERLLEQVRARSAEVGQNLQEQEDEPRLQAGTLKGEVELSANSADLFSGFARRFESNLVTVLQAQDRFRLMRNVDEFTTRISLAVRAEQITNELRSLERRRLLLIDPALEWDNQRSAEVVAADRQAVVRRIQAGYGAASEGRVYWDMLKQEAEALHRYLAFLQRTWGVWTVEKEGVYWVKYSDYAMGAEHGRLREVLDRQSKAAVQAYARWVDKAWGGIYGREPELPPPVRTRPKALPKGQGRE